MGKGKQIIIDLTSSDSSSDEFPDTPQAPSRPYLPPYHPPTFGCRTKEQARKFKHDINAHILKPLENMKPISSKKKTKKSKPPSVPKAPTTQPQWFEELPAALQQALDKAMEKMPSSSKSPQQPTAPKPKKPFQAAQPSTSTGKRPRVTGSRPICVGLVAPRVWEMASQSMGQKRTMPDCDDLVDAMSLFALVEREKEQKKKQDPKNKGKRPME